jgi:hypothetical protein
LTDPKPERAQQHLEAQIDAPGEVARLLTGDLPCVVCKYNLRSLSIRHVCPECGTPVRVTLLAVVDPYASVLQPICFPKAVAVGLVLWSAAALGAALMTWIQRLRDGYIELANTELPAGPWALLGTSMIIASAIGALVLIRPHARIPIWQSIVAAAAILCMFALAVAYWNLHGRYDPSHSRPFIEAPAGGGVRIWVRLLLGALMIAAIVGLRANARLLAARSLVLRLGRTDRQTMLAMVGALCVAALGDGLRLVAFQTREPIAPALTTAGTILVAIGSLLFTLGLVGVFKDCIKIAQVVVRPPAALGDVVGEHG